jgi:hypothetical protein
MAREARKEDEHSFQMYGLSARPPATLNAALVQAIESMHRTLYGEAKGEITAQEFQFLTDAGIDVEEHPEVPDR